MMTTPEPALSFFSGPWVGIISDTSAEALGKIRLVPHLEAARNGDWIWIRSLNSGKTASQDEFLVNTIPWQERYRLVEGALLQPLQSLLPSGRLPNLTWQRLDSFLVPALGRTMLPGVWPAILPPPIAPEYQAGFKALEPHYLLVTSDAWLHYAETAAEIRLKPLRFAQASRGVCLITGEPLPAIPGTYHLLHEQTLWPIGLAPLEISSLFDWSIYLDLKKGDLALIHADGSCEMIPSSAWITASRSAARLTVQPHRYA